MPERFVVTGCGRSGTRYLSTVLTRCGVPTLHEVAFRPGAIGDWKSGQVGECSWMAACHLDEIDYPIALLVRDPLAVARSWCQIGFFDWDTDNPTHQPLRERFPEVYMYERSRDKALAMWIALTRRTLARASIIIRLDNLAAPEVSRLVRWAGATNTVLASLVMREIPRVNLHATSKRKTADMGIEAPTLKYSEYDFYLALRARDLANSLGFSAVKAKISL